MDDEFDFFDEDELPEGMKEMLEQQQAEYNKAYGAQINAIDALYDFVNGLSEKDMEAFLKLMQSCATDDSQPPFWAGYARAMRLAKYGVNPNPYAPKFDPADVPEMTPPPAATNERDFECHTCGAELNGVPGSAPDCPNCADTMKPKMI